jgi:DNA polymerase I-like protein with 3'-5' exonuclease and polymerase domains
MRNPYIPNVKYYGLLEGAEQLFQPDFGEFEDWVFKQQYLQHDVETNVTKHVRERKLITVQFGSVNQPEAVQWVFQWSYLTEYQKNFIKMVLESDRWEKLIHNAAFELMVWLNHGVRIRRIYDTMLVERILWCGYSGVHQVSSSLQDTARRRLWVEMLKDEGTNFGDDHITSSKIRYAAEDTQYLGIIKGQQLLELHVHNLEYVAALENESVIGFAQMMWEGMTLDREDWLSNIEWARPLIEEAEAKCDEWLEKEPFRSRAIKLGYINTEDKVLINWNSNNHKRLIAEKLFPGCPGATKPVVSKWMSKAPHELQVLAYEFLNGTPKTELEKHLLSEHREWLIDVELLRPAGTSIINWNSVDQVLPLIQVVDPRLKNMNEDSMGKFSHPIGLDIEHYKERLKLLSTYGEAFLEHIDPDGLVRTSFNQIVTTGRVSSSDPNMQNVPAKEFVGMRYRNCFKPLPGYKFVSSDYVSQELVCIAYITQDKLWQDALRKGQDLHSVACELVFASTKNPYHISWKHAAEKDCAYYKPVRNEKGQIESAKMKCKCPKHKVMRDACKNINFGLAYGMSEYRLAAMLRISVPEARALIQDYYKAMPAIGKTMTFLGNFGLKHGYIQTMAPFFRKRWFPDWAIENRFLDEHMAGVRYNKRLSSIEKAAKNQPIQGTSADITKVAICMVMWELDEKNLHDTVKLVLQVHDQLDTVARDDYAEQWKPRLTEIMEDAAKLIITNGLLKAETTITDVWSK